MRLLRGLLLKPALNLLNWILKNNGNSVIIGGPLGWSWQPTIDASHHGSLEGPANAHRHQDLANIGPDDHHDRDHATRHQDGGADEINIAGLDGEPSALTTHKDLATGVHGVGSYYVARAPVSGHLVRLFTRGWSVGKRLRGAGVNADPAEFDDVIAIAFIIDGGGAVITTGSKGYLEIPFACTITGWTILSDVVGSIVVDVRRSTYADFPTTSSIAGTEKPTISSARKGQDLSLTTWSTSISAGDILEFVVESVSAVTRVTVSLRGIKA